MTKFFLLLSIVFLTVLTLSSGIMKREDDLRTITSDVLRDKIADIYVDGSFKRTIDSYFSFVQQLPGNNNIFIINQLPEGKHTVRIVIKNEKRAYAEGVNIYLSEAVIYKTGNKIKEGYQFSF